MSTGSVWANLSDTLKCGDSEYPLLVQVYGYMSYTTWKIAIFVLKFANFRYHGNRGRSEQFLTVTFKQADPQNRLLGASIWVIYITLGEL